MKTGDFLSSVTEDSQWWRHRVRSSTGTSLPHARPVESGTSSDKPNRNEGQMKERGGGISFESV